MDSDSPGASNLIWEKFASYWCTLPGKTGGY